MAEWKMARAAAVVLVLCAGCSGTPGELDGGAALEDAGDLPAPDAGVDAGGDCPGLCPEAAPICALDTLRCVECLQDSDCSVGMEVCDPSARSCTRCLSNANCSGSTPICNAEVPGGRCQGCLSDADCTVAGTKCDPLSFTCLGDGESCVAPKLLTVPQGGLTFTVDLSKAHDDDYGACGDGGPIGNGELVYQVVLTEPRDLVVRVEAETGSNADAVIYVRKGACTDRTSLECVDVDGPLELLRLFNKPAGTYFVFIEAFKTYGGKAKVTISLETPSLPSPNDTCEFPEPIVLTGGVANFTVGMALSTDDEAGGCNTVPNSPERVYSLTLMDPRVVSVELESAPDVYPVLYVRGDPCEGGAELGCTAADVDGPAYLTSRVLQPGTYHFFVEVAGNGKRGPVEVTLHALPIAANSTCQSAQTLNIPTGGSTTFGVDTLGAGNQEVSSCYSSTAANFGEEAVYELTLTQTQDITVTATPPAGSTVDAVLYATVGACGLGMQFACNDDGSGGDVETLVVKNAGPATYYLYVETYGSKAGYFDVTVQLGPPTHASAESCAEPDAVVLSSSGMAASFEVLTGGAADNHPGTCNPTGADPERVYSLYLTDPGTVTVTATTANAMVDPVLYVRFPGCYQTGSAPLYNEIACANATLAGGAETLTLPNLAAGKYSLFVESDGPTTGAIDVTITVTP